MLIINAKIYTMEDAVIIENGYLQTSGDKIADFGNMTNLPANKNGEVFDAKGAILVPGFIDAHCHIGMWEDSVGIEGDDGNEETDPVTPHLRAIDAINPSDRAFEEAIKAGVTTVVTGPGSTNPLAGQLCAIKTYGKRIDDMIVKSPVGMKMALGENPKITYNEKHQSPVTRMSIAAIIREQLFKSMRYLQDKEKAKNSKDIDEPEYDFKYEALIPVLKGEIPVHFHAHRADDIFTAIRISKEFGLKYVLIHCTDGHLISDELKAENAMVLCGTALCDRSKPELQNLTFKTPAELDKKGIACAIVTDHPETPIQYLSLCAALAKKEGMDYMSALKAITINPAKICGIDDRVGSIKVGKDADFAIFNGNPLDILNSDCIFVAINGMRVK